MLVRSHVLVLIVIIGVFDKVSAKVGFKNQLEIYHKEPEIFEWNRQDEYECKSEQQPVVESYHLNGMQYLFFSQRLTWEEARMLCLNYNAKLAVLDNMEKAINMAEAIADSNIVMEDTWLGGRRTGRIWTWIQDNGGSRRSIEIPVESNMEDYPPWSRKPVRPTKECLAIDRRAHSHPNFIDLDCRLQRPFICEKRPEEALKKPMPSKWIKIHRYTYTLYHASVTWQEAATYCRLLGARLAIIRNPTVVEILANSMTKTRPDFEMVWIGAHYSHGQWIWMATGATLNSVPDENGFPPWRHGRSEKKGGCLLLDRHIDNTASFVEIGCNRKRDFVCEEYPDDEEDDWLNEPIRFSHNQSIYVIYPMEKSWKESREFCREQGSVLAYVNDINATNLIIEAMGDHPKEISHIWIGGLLYNKSNEWQWISSGRRIASKKDSTGFPPWANINERLDYFAGSSTCLNLDRSDHVKPHMYGLDCGSKQPFVCRITCDAPPPIKNGSWICEDVESGKSCWLRCDEGFLIMGVSNASCSYRNGWSSGQDFLEIPLCLEVKNYTRRMIRSLSRDMQSSTGYYFILDHPNVKMRSLSLTFVERILNIFPINYNLKMGMSCLVTDPPVYMSFNQTDTCVVLHAISMIKNRIITVDKTVDVDSKMVYKNLWTYPGSKITIFAVIDAKIGRRYTEILTEMKAMGKNVVVIGSKNDWEFLSPLVSIGIDKLKNMYVVDENEFNGIIEELDGLKRKPTKCPPQQVDANKESTNDTANFRMIEKKEGNVTMHSTANSAYITNADNLSTESIRMTTPHSPFLPKIYQTQDQEENKKDNREESKQDTVSESLRDSHRKQSETEQVEKEGTVNQKTEKK